jgi:hypothetical protein
MPLPGRRFIKIPCHGDYIFLYESDPEFELYAESLRRNFNGQDIVEGGENGKS